MPQTYDVSYKFVIIIILINKLIGIGSKKPWVEINARYVLKILRAYQNNIQAMFEARYGMSV